MFELPRLVEAIQMITNNICFHKENQKKNRINIIKYALIQFPAYLSDITKTRLFKYMENFGLQKLKIFR